MVDRLTNFLLAATETPFEWGRHDCALWLADWWHENHGTDPAAHLRGTYSDESGKDFVVIGSGGLTELVSGLARSVGAVGVAIPRAGDFGIITVAGHEFCAIWQGEYWAVRAPRGITMVSRPSSFVAWSI